MNPQETQQVAAHDEKWVPSAERVKINSTNIRLETTVPQKEETFQVVIDIIKNSTCFKDFTISADVPEIFMQQLCGITNLATLEVMGMGIGYYPGDLKVFAGKKKENRIVTGYGRKRVYSAVCTVL
nr:hypothetical protein [Tanacetum cinerariifolium]